VEVLEALAQPGRWNLRTTLVVVTRSVRDVTAQVGTGVAAALICALIGFGDASVVSVAVSSVVGACVGGLARWVHDSLPGAWAIYRSTVVAIVVFAFQLVIGVICSVQGFPMATRRQIRTQANLLSMVGGVGHVVWFSKKAASRNIQRLLDAR
jgi:hypothetical protein